MSQVKKGEKNRLLLPEHLGRDELKLVRESREKITTNLLQKYQRNFSSQINCYTESLWLSRGMMCVTIVFMTATGHAIIGTVIAAKIANPYLAIPIAISSHFAADLFPHWDTATNLRKKGVTRVFTETIIDVFLGLTTSYLVLNYLSPSADFSYALLIIIFAQLPDWLMSPYVFFKIKLFKWAYDIQQPFNKKLDKPWGIINQIAVLVLIVILAKVF